ncbi:MAG: 5-formyltetrahydrofolate cyclo-ligase [Gammaproteobacteria bacterium]|nr:5-formyltetrahydrofolate cyclo-ligase [Gammaproteobacteria bacterium]
MTNVMKEIRTAALSARREMSVENRARASEKICNKVTSSREFRTATLIACYLSTPDEVDTRIIVQRAWRAKKRIFTPISRKSGEMFFREIRPGTPLISNRMGLWEPVTGDFISPRALQLVITPTVAFDKLNHRIGMGGGYYDQCFSFLRHRTHWQKPKLLGIAFRCQKVEKISPNIWDLRLYRVVDESS